MSNKVKQFFFFCGKGGVGKTTCAAATAISLSLSGSKTLLFSTDPAHSLADSLEQPIGNKITSIKKVTNLYAIEINAPSELKSFIQTYQNEITEFFNLTSYLDSEDIGKILLLSLPGVDELMAMKKIIDFIELDSDFNCFVCDTAPTGHALQLISMPDVVTEWIKVLAGIQWKYMYAMSRFSSKVVEDNELLLILKRIVSKVKAAIRNPAQTKFNVVTIPEAMAVSETSRLISSLKKLEIKVPNIIINKIIPENDRCIFCSSFRNSQNNYIQELKQKFPNINIISKLSNCSEIKGISELITFSKDLSLLGVQ